MLASPKPCPYGTCPPSGCQVGTASGCCGPVGVAGDDGPPGFLAGLQEGLRLFTEEECEPTAQSCRQPPTPSVMQLIQHKPNEEVIGLLERMLSYARAGELIGLVAFGHHTGKETMDAQAGDTDFSAILAAFEDWKFRRVWRRNRTDEPDDQ
jgi:hypothetical protein